MTISFYKKDKKYLKNLYANAKAIHANKTLSENHKLLSSFRNIIKCIRLLFHRRKSFD